MYFSLRGILSRPSEKDELGEIAGKEREIERNRSAEMFPDGDHVLWTSPRG